MEEINTKGVMTCVVSCYLGTVYSLLVHFMYLITELVEIEVGFTTVRENEGNHRSNLED